MQVLAVGLNLYVISENCDINKNRPPLLPGSSKTAKLASGGRKGFSSWNGVVFANGTRLDKTPPGLRLGCAETLPKGTVFGNGTVLDRELLNHGCQTQASNSSLPTFDVKSRRRHRRRIAGPW